MIRWMLPALLLFAVVLSPGFAPPARAADLSVNVYAENFAWHVNAQSSTETTITVTRGDTIHLRIENLDTADHTFTAPQFPAAAGQGGNGTTLNITLAPGAVFVWNHTLTAAEEGNWQFYCIPHSGGTYPNRNGMVGLFSVRAPAPPPAPGFEVVVVLAAVVGVAIAIRVARRRA